MPARDIVHRSSSLPYQRDSLRFASWNTPPDLAFDSLRESRTVQKFWILLLLTLFVATVIRVYLLLQSYAVPDADQTVIGIMARHIQHGERPIFYWGQPYTGSGDAYLIALLFSFFGQHDVLLHLPPLAASLIFLGCTMLFAWRVYGLGVALLCSIFLACAPTLLIDWSMWAGSGYLEVLALGGCAFLLTLPPKTGKFSCAQLWIRFPLAFLVLGFALWIQPIAVYYLLALCMMYLGSMWCTLRSPRRWLNGISLGLCCLVSYIVGMFPLLHFNVTHDAATLHFLANRAPHISILTVVSRTLFWAAPVVLGFLPPTTSRSYFITFMLEHWVLYGFALWCVLACGARGCLVWRSIVLRLRTLISPTPARDLGLILLLFLVLLGYCLSGWGAEQWSGSQPRYLLPLYTTLPLIIRALLPYRPVFWHWLIALSTAILFTGVSFYINTGVPAREDLSPLAQLLQERGITALYGDYWTVYPLTYASEEVLQGVAVNDDLSKGFNRYAPYLRTAATSTHYAWIVQTGSARHRSVLACLQRLHSQYVTITWRNQTIYDRPTRQAFPWWNGGRCTIQL